MELTTKQKEGLRLAIERYQAGEKYTCIAGYAGAGKSTLIRFIIEGLNLDPEWDVAYCSFTGKAAEVLRNKGCPNACTAHKLLYYSKQLANGRFAHYPRKSLEKDFKVIVVDEISMLPKDLWDLLLTHDTYVLACGDPFQLPPVSKDQNNHVLDIPHIFLDEIMRQAAESDIIKMTMDIRAGIPPKYMKGNDIHIVPEANIVDGMYFWADQIIVGTNNKRHEINDYMRQAYNMGEEPADGDKVICLRNCWDTLSDEEAPLVNGTIGILRNPRRELQKFMTYKQTLSAFVLIADIEVGNDTYHDILIDYRALKTGKKTFTPEQEYQMAKRGTPAPIEFNYGYAVTCHRAQGSEWDKVFVIEERFPFDKTEHARWLYTACTRASSKLVLAT